MSSMCPLIYCCSEAIRKRKPQKNPVINFYIYIYTFYFIFYIFFVLLLFSGCLCVRVINLDFIVRIFLGSVNVM